MSVFRAMISIREDGNFKYKKTAGTMEKLSQILEKDAKSQGADFYGSVDVSVYLDSTYSGNKPQDIMPWAKSIILIGTTLPSGSFESLPKGRAEYTNTLLSGTVLLRHIAYNLAKKIEREGFKATIAPCEGSEFGYWYANRETLFADFSFKYTAYKAGLGCFGMNHLLITDEFGAAVRMIAIVSDIPVVSKKQERPLIHEFCKTCKKCIDICPPKALHENGTIERKRCANYMFETLGGLRCGMCLKVCPYLSLKK